MPLFVVTDNEKLASMAKFIHKSYAPQIYKLKETQKLFANIVEDVSNNPEFRIRKKYSVVCEYCNNCVPIGGSGSICRNCVKGYRNTNDNSIVCPENCKDCVKKRYFLVIIVEIIDK